MTTPTLTPVIQRHWIYWNVLPNPDVLAAKIAEDPRAALEQFSGMAEELAGEDNE